MQKKYFSFVVLHYNVIEETKKCVSSIKKCMEDGFFSIVVVDNASLNGSGKELAEFYRNDRQVTVILNDKNEGFARGNNLGISYVRKNTQSDFVVVLNNDTIILQDVFAQLVEKEWNASHFAVLGPKIITPSGDNQNPCPKKIQTRQMVLWEFARSFAGVFLAALMLENIWLNFKKMIKFILKKDGCTGACYKRMQEERQENVKLHGSFWIFSKVFFEHFQGLDARTFLYVEEDILWNHLKNKHLLSVYNPSIKILHNESVATKSTMRSHRKKRLFYWKERIKSLCVLYNVVRYE